MKNPLLRIFLCVKQAAFGIEVVPLVNWILIMSSTCKLMPLISAEDWFKKISLKGVVPRSLLKEVLELSTIMILRREGTEADCKRLESSMAGAICFSNVVFSRGCLNGRLVSAPIKRCEAERCESAEIT